MNHALAPALDHYVSDPVADHLSCLIGKLVAAKVGVLGGAHSRLIRLLAAGPDSPVVSALSEHMRDLAIQGFEFRMVFADDGPKTSAEALAAALERAKAGLSKREGVLRLIGGPAARKVNESLVLGERLAWIGAPLPHKWEAQTDFGQTIQRPSAVHLAAMGFESIRVGSHTWTVQPAEAAEPKSRQNIIQSLFDWRPGENR
jgi:hypothetical protein